METKRRYLGHIRIFVALIGALASVGCGFEGNAVVVQTVRSPSGEYFVENVHTDLTAPLQSSKTIVSIFMDDGSWWLRNELVVLLQSSHIAAIQWRSNTEVIVDVVGKARQFDVIEMGPNTWNGIRIRLKVDGEEIDQDEWNRAFHSDSKLLTEEEAKLLVMNSPRVLAAVEDGRNPRAERIDSRRSDHAYFQVRSTRTDGESEIIGSYWVDLETWELFAGANMTERVDSYWLDMARATTQDRRAR